MKHKTKTLQFQEGTSLDQWQPTDVTQATFSGEMIQGRFYHGYLIQSKINYSWFNLSQTKSQFVTGSKRSNISNLNARKIESLCTLLDNKTFPSHRQNKINWHQKNDKEKNKYLIMFQSLQRLRKLVWTYSILQPHLVWNSANFRHQHHHGAGQRVYHVEITGLIHVSSGL